MSRRHGYSPHHCIHIDSFQCQGKRVAFDSFRWFFIGKWGTAGEKPRAPPSHQRVSHDQTTLWIDTSLSNAGLLAVKTQAQRMDGRVPTMDKEWKLGWRMVEGVEDVQEDNEGPGEKICLSRNLWTFGRRTATRGSSESLPRVSSWVVEDLGLFGFVLFFCHSHVAGGSSFLPPSPPLPLPLWQNPCSLSDVRLIRWVWSSLSVDLKTIRLFSPSPFLLLLLHLLLGWELTMTKTHS